MLSLQGSVPLWSFQLAQPSSICKSNLYKNQHGKNRVGKSTRFLFAYKKSA